MHKPWFTVNASADNKEATIRMYGYIYNGGDVDSASFTKCLDDLVNKGAEKINVRINSGGGDISEGIAIYNAIQNCPVTVDTWIDALAASMGGIVAMAGDTIHMAKNAKLMIHKPSGGSYGSAAKMREYADMMDSWEASLKEAFVDRTGKSAEDVDKWFAENKDNWFNATEAKANGLINDIFENNIKKAVPKNIMTAGLTQVWNFYSEQLTTTNDQTQPNDMDIKLILAANLPIMGLKETSTEAEFVSIVKAAFTEKDKTITDHLKTIEDLTETIATAAAKEVEDKVTALVDAAIADGRILAGEKEDWVKDATANYDMAKRHLDKIVPVASASSQIDKARKIDANTAEVPAASTAAARLAKIAAKNAGK